MALSTKASWLRSLARAKGSIEGIALLPAFVLCWGWFGPKGTAVLAAAIIPVVLLFAQRARIVSDHTDGLPATVSGMPTRETVVAALDRACKTYDATGRGAACLIVRLDDTPRILETYGQLAHDRVLREIGTRIRDVLRECDILSRIDGGRFAIASEPMLRMDLEAAIQIASRIKTAVEQPVSIDSTTAYFSISIGFCLCSRAPEATGLSVFEAAELALEDAARNGPAAIRAYSREIAQAAVDRESLRNEVECALERGDIIAHFQPQLSTDTGEVVGFEALARWQHPVRGLLAPSEFLPAVLSCGLSRHLSELMLHQALTALRDWDRAGFSVPANGVNFSREELSDPNLVSRIKWELDRFDIMPNRLNIEILESVVATSADDIVVRNIAELSKLGCGIDLDDFGTGHASISSIRRFAVNRIKIDRSFITKVDTDQSQQRLVGAILSMAERLGLTTLAEGIESIGEHAHLAQLGCTHVQGFAIARPMPFAQTLDWMARHRAKLASSPGLIRKRTG